jgi:hypothetical protein
MCIRSVLSRFPVSQMPMWAIKKRRCFFDHHPKCDVTDRITTLFLAVSCLSCSFLESQLLSFRPRSLPMLEYASSFIWFIDFQIYWNLTGISAKCVKRHRHSGKAMGWKAAIFQWWMVVIVSAKIYTKAGHFTKSFHPSSLPESRTLARSEYLYHLYHLRSFFGHSTSLSCRLTEHHVFFAPYPFELEIRNLAERPGINGC